MPSLSGPIGLLFVGDSIAAEYIYGLGALMKQLNISYDARGGAGCLILYGVTISKPTRRKECKERRNESLAWLERKDQPIIYAQNWRQYDDSAIEYEFESPDHRSNEKARSASCRRRLNSPSEGL
jgi:hypothetical protein